MLSLMFHLIQYTFKYIFGYLNKTELDLDDIISRIESAKNRDVDAKEKAETLSKEGYYRKMGSITRVATDYVLIDGRYTYEKDDELTNNLKVGDQINYLALLQNSELKVCKIVSVIDNNDLWDNVNTQTKKNVTGHAHMIQRSVIAQVTSREGRIVIVEPNNIRINLNKVQSEFVPFVGDWLILESLVELNSDSIDLSGEILEVNKIKPLCSKLNTGVISQYDAGKQVGVIDKSIIFHKSMCEPGYIPCVGDKVVSDSIESDQMLYRWRSLTVVPLIQISKKTSISLPMNNFHSILSDTSDLLSDKCGIVIDDELRFDLDIEEESTLTISIRNDGNYTHVLRNGSFVSQKTPSQLSVISSSTRTTDINVVINPSESISYMFKCKAEFVGRSEELYIFDFKDFKIGRLFHINVNARNVSRNIATSTPIVRKNSQNINLLNLEEFNEMTYIPGIRPYKPPAFIKKRNTLFKVPRYIWNAVIDMQSTNSQMESEIALGNKISCLLKPLSFEIYKERFHVLLYLEEIAQTLNLQQYDIESAIMRRCGDYLALQVPGLAEKRPSLLVGDRAIVSFKWDNSQGNLKYEGFIHKITGIEIFLKFNDKFHQKYNREDCQVTFKCSQITIQRCHNAVNLVICRLGSDFLFPTKVIEKEPQFHLEEYETKERSCHTRDSHKANESISSTCSSDSIASNSDTSLDNTTKASLRMSVIERLFSVKPAELSSVEIKTSPAEIDTNQNLSTNLVRNGNSVEADAVNITVSEKSNRLTTQIDDKLEPYITQIKKRKLKWFNKNLNHYQKEAVRNILRGVARPLPYVIFGPPGTGKTMTLCEAILQILNVISESRLLVATPSNSSANLIAERLLDSNILKPGDLVRLIAHHCLNDDSIPEKLLPYCATTELATEGSQERFYHREDGSRMNCTMSILGRHRITIGTCTTLGILYNMGFPRGHFSHILIDEAGQATEPEIMIPLSLVHSDHGQVILAGDPMQLGPIIQSKLAEYYGLGESFLSRLLHQFPYQRDPEGYETCYDPRLVTKLLFNYRSLPEILHLPNSLFYDSELQPQISSKWSEEAEILNRLKAELPERDGLPPAIIFHGVNGDNCRDSDSPSWYNPGEATQAYLYLLKLYKYGFEPDDIGIITPYQKQVIQIRDLLTELDLKLPKISSVEGFQGQERKVIILSTVRSCNNLIDEDIKYALGFVASPRRLNVAITRARALLIILGNPKLLALDPYWRNVLLYCIDHNAYTGCNFLPSYITDNL